MKLHEKLGLGLLSGYIALAGIVLGTQWLYDNYL